MGFMPTAAFTIAAAVGLFVYAAVLRFLYINSDVKALSTAQYGVSIVYAIVFSLWLGAEAGFLAAKMQPRYDSISEDEQDLVSDAEKSSKNGEESDSMLTKTAIPPETSICGIKHSQLKALRFAAEFVGIMGFLYLCDRTSLVAKGPKYVDKTSFWCVNGAILLLALFSLRGGGSSTTAAATGGTSDPIQSHVKPLQRDQSEEWKGWMQIMFVLYHYFAEAEIYNAIRMYIAAYVWMTGFGNFSYYYIKKDFTATRFAQMMWRLNFFVIFVCLAMNNEYMLYYICPMHTFFTFGVFFPLYFCNHLNDSFKVLYLKIFLTGCLAALLYDVPNVFNTVMAPLHSILDFHDPLHPENSPSHEWFFRSGLDHFVWVFGMLCAVRTPRHTHARHAPLSLRLLFSPSLSLHSPRSAPSRGSTRS